ncbi:MAG: glycosyltransferase [Candidatus Zixiibacteriota bacterium]
MEKNITGERLFNEGRYAEAENFFQNILRDNPRDKEAYNNLGVLALQKKDLDEALEFFKRALEIDPLYKIALLNYTEIAKTVKSPSAKMILKRYLERYPADREVTDALEKFETVFRERPKISFICLPTMDAFLGDIIKYFQTRYEVRACISNDLKEIEAAIIWGDIIWLEWANEMTIALTKQPHIFKYKRVICRLHSYEAINGYAQKINWKQIDDVIFVADHIRTLVQQQVPELGRKVRIHTVPNGIDLGRFKLVEKERGKNLAFLGNVNFKKGPMLLLHAFRELVNRYDGYRLHIGGEIKDSRYALYFSRMTRELNLEDKIILDGWIDDVPAWLVDKHYIVCTSPLEGHPVGLMEAMACGCKPVIHNFVGADGIYPGEYLWNSIDDFTGMITANDYNPAAYREYIERKFSLDRQLASLEQIIDDDNSEIAVSENEPAAGADEFKLPPVSEPPEASPDNGWQYPDAMFSPDPKLRIESLTREAAIQIQQKRPDLAETTLLRLAKMTGYENEAVNLNLVKIYQANENIPAIQEVFKRAATTALEEDRYDEFLNFAYLSIYAENLFSRNPNYQYARVDEDINTYIRLAAARHPLQQWVRDNRPVDRLPGQKLKVGFLLEGFSQTQAPSRTYYPLAEYHDREKYELFFYSRWSLDEAMAKKENYDVTVKFLQEQNCRAVCPDRRLSPTEQAAFLTKRIVRDEIDILVYQTTYFVPVYNFISCLHPAPCQAALEHQQSEYSKEMDLIFTTRKQYSESSTLAAPGVIPFTRKTDVAAHRRRDFGIPDEAPVLISVNRERRYHQPEFWREIQAVLAKNPNVYFVAVGLADTNELVHSSAPERSRIITPGFRTDVMEFLKMADVYIDLFPAGTGSSLIEAMQAGLPVVCFAQDYGTLYRVAENSLGAEFVNHPELVIPVKNYPRWRLTVQRLLKDKDLRRRLSRDMTERARHYEPRQVTESVFAQLEQITRKKQETVSVPT